MSCYRSTYRYSREEYPRRARLPGLAVRVFEHGYLTRVIVGDRGVFVTTDELDMKSFDELATAVRDVLASA